MSERPECTNQPNKIAMKMCQSTTVHDNSPTFDYFFKNIF